jgi:hypothetical protein
MVGLAKIGPMMRLPKRFLAGAVACLAIGPLKAELLYATAFEAFTPGADNWVGTEGWLGNSTGWDTHGIHFRKFPDLDNTAYLGGKQPDALLVSVYKHFDHDPATEQSARIWVDTVIGIHDSENGNRDSFFVSIYNIDGYFLAAIRFANENDSFGIWRLDSPTGQHDTGAKFIRDDLFPLFIDIDFKHNRWSADLYGFEVFTNQPFTTTGLDHDFGALAYEWQLAEEGPPENLTGLYGDNWMPVVDCIVWAVPSGEQPFVVDTIGENPSGQTVLTWTGEPGWIYQVEYSDDLDTWRGDLPGSLFDDITVPSQLDFTDPTTPRPIGRYYRIARSVKP